MAGWRRPREQHGHEEHHRGARRAGGTRARRRADGGRRVARDAGSGGWRLAVRPPDRAEGHRVARHAVQRDRVPALLGGEGRAGHGGARDGRLRGDHHRGRRRRLAGGVVSQRRQPGAAGDPASRGPRALAGDVGARATHGPVGCDVDRRLREHASGDRASEREAGSGGNDHLQHRRLRPFRGAGAGRQLRPHPLRRLLRVHVDRRARRRGRRARHAARPVSRRPPHADPLHRGAEHRPSPPQGAHRDHSRRTPPGRSALPFPISTVAS